MDIEELVDLIMEETRHSDPQADDPRVNERCIRADVWALIETYTEGIISDRIRELERQLGAIEEAQNE